MHLLIEKSAARFSKSVGRIPKMYGKPLVFIANSVHALCRVGTPWDKKQMEKTMPTSTKKRAFSIKKGIQKSSKRRRRKDNEQSSKKGAKMEPKLNRNSSQNQQETRPTKSHRFFFSRIFIFFYYI